VGAAAAYLARKRQDRIAKEE